MAPGARAIAVGKAKWKSLKGLLISAKVGSQKHLAGMGEEEVIGSPPHFSINFARLGFEEIGQNDCKCCADVVSFITED